MDNFQLFDNQNTIRVVDKITITKNYLINFPSAFCTINKLENKKSVLIYYDKEAMRIGLEFMDEPDSRGFKITKAVGENKGGYITAKSFFAINGLIGQIRTGRYEYQTKEIKKEENGGCTLKLFVITLESKN